MRSNIKPSGIHNILATAAEKKIISRWRGYHGRGLNDPDRLTGPVAVSRQFDLTA